MQNSHFTIIEFKTSRKIEWFRKPKNRFPLDTIHILNFNKDHAKEIGL